MMDPIQFVDQVANLDYSEDPQDCIDTLNRLIQEAREIVAGEVMP